MAKYTCNKKKEEILKIVVEHFYEVNRFYDKVYGNNEEKFLKDRATGSYNTMMDLLHKLEIHENE